MEKSEFNPLYAEIYEDTFMPFRTIREPQPLPFEQELFDWKPGSAANTLCQKAESEDLITRVLGEIPAPVPQAQRTADPSVPADLWRELISTLNLPTTPMASPYFVKRTVRKSLAEHRDALSKIVDKFRLKLGVTLSDANADALQRVTESCTAFVAESLAGL